VHCLSRRHAGWQSPDAILLNCKAKQEATSELFDTSNFKEIGVLETLPAKKNFSGQSCQLFSCGKSPTSQADAGSTCPRGTMGLKKEFQKLGANWMSQRLSDSPVAVPAAIVARWTGVSVPHSSVDMGVDGSSCTAGEALGR
jgi:hypothetical protein